MSAPTIAQDMPVSRHACGHMLPTPKTTLASQEERHSKEDKYRIDSAEFNRAVHEAVILAGRKGLITYHDLPLPWRTNAFVVGGYRFTPSLIATMLSPLVLSNELANIWTHLAPVALVLRYPMYSIPPFSRFRDGGLGRDLDAVIAAGYFACVVAALLCSTAWHTFRCCSRVKVMSAFVSVDIMAISVILTAFTVLMIHVAFYSQQGLRAFYTVCTLAWCATGMLLPWTNFFRPVEVAPLKLAVVAKWPLSRSWTRVLFFASLGFQGVVVPAVHATALSGWAYTSEIYYLAGRVAGPILLGAVVYASKFPEKQWPGRFDYIGNSHNIWHVATAITAIQGCEVMERMFEFAWRSQGQR